MNPIIELLLQSALAFLLSATLTFSELVYGTYAKDASLVLKKVKYPLLYSAIFGAVAVLAFLAINLGGLKINDLKLADAPWVLAIIIALAARPISKISFYDLSIGEQKIAIGPKLVFAHLEDYLIAKMEENITRLRLTKVNRVVPKLSALKDAEQMDAAIKRVLPQGLQKIYLEAFEQSLRSKPDAFSKCSYLVQKYGISRLLILEEQLNAQTP